MPENDLNLLIRAAHAAGDVARGYAAQNGGQNWDKANGAGPVTEADLAVNELLHTKLTTARKEYGWLSEESLDDQTRLNCDRTFIIDPIDGTRSFIEGAPYWAHSLAVVEQGQVIAAVVYLPMRDKLYTAARGQGAWLNGQAVRASDCVQLSGAEVLAAKSALAAQHWAGDVPDIKRGYRPSLAYRLALVAEGRFDAMLTIRQTWEWDIAAGVLIAAEAGAGASDRLGNALYFNKPDPRTDGVVVTTSGLQEQIITALS